MEVHRFGWQRTVTRRRMSKRCAHPTLIWIVSPTYVSLAISARKRSTPPTHTHTAERFEKEALDEIGGGYRLSAVGGGPSTTSILATSPGRRRYTPVVADRDNNGRAGWTNTLAQRHLTPIGRSSRSVQRSPSRAPPPPLPRPSGGSKPWESSPSQKKYYPLPPKKSTSPD